MTSDYFEQNMPVVDLHLDTRNPRMPDEAFDTEDEVVAYLVNNADVEELVESIGNSGWLDYEPLIVLNDGTVLEGNRRLVAIRVLADENVRAQTGLRIPEPLHSGAKPNSVRVRIVDSRAAAREYIGFKHINGAFKWDALAKARYAWDWLQDEPDLSIRTVSERLGDRHQTVSRMINGYIVLTQAEKNGFDRSDIEKKTFHFSHIYSCLAAPSVRTYLGLPEPSGELLSSDPVPPERIVNLLRLVTWLYGQGTQQALIRSQNPDLNMLVAVLSNTSTTKVLENTSKLENAYAPFEDRGGRFTEALYELSNMAKDVLKLLSDYDRNPELVAVAEALEKDFRTLKNTMRTELANDPDDK